MAEDIRPRTVRNPLGGIGFEAWVSARACKEKSPKVLAKSLLSKLDIGCKHEGEKKFMLFEERPADIFIEGIGEIVDEIEKSHLELFGRQCILHSHLE